jgi:hypothetical protein
MEERRAIARREAEETAARLPRAELPVSGGDQGEAVINPRDVVGVCLYMARPSPGSVR